MDLRQIQYKEWTCNVRKEQYRNGRTALTLTDVQDGDSIATASVNIPSFFLEDDEVIIKSWSENEGMADVLITNGIIGSELGRIPTGHVVATVHKLLI